LLATEHPSFEKQCKKEHQMPFHPPQAAVENIFPTKKMEQLQRGTVHQMILHEK